MRALVTGASGFVGRQAIAALAGRGHEVHAVSRRPAGDPDLPAFGAVTWHSADLLDPEQSARLAAELGATHLLHLAWYVEQGDYWTSSENARWVEPSLALIRAFGEAGGRRVAISGTCAEYELSSEPLAEGSTPVRPRSPYTKAKNELREAASRLAAATGLELAWARLFFLFGPHEDPSRLVPSIARSVLAGEAAPATDGEQARDFLYVEDAGDALAAILESGVEGPVNVGSGDAVKVRTVAELTAAAAGNPGLLRIGALERPPDDPELIVADVERLRSEVGWSPRFSLADGVAASVAYWREATG